MRPAYVARRVSRWVEVGDGVEEVLGIVAVGDGVEEDVGTAVVADRAGELAVPLCGVPSFGVNRIVNISRATAVAKPTISVTSGPARFMRVA
jgi:hypothetical protein